VIEGLDDLDLEYPKVSERAAGGEEGFISKVSKRS
jgi:hypothetical protein